ncbi:hypothetical protein EYR40_009339 [Pleurotus pulmonarius]|nr:hypothetical protein EYR40_009339 [Pleurotus pulmonarius]
MERKDSIESTEKIVILEGPLTTNEHSDAEFESVVWRKVDICVVGWGSHRILPLIMVVTTLQGTVHTFGGLLACRFFLGFFEGIVHRWDDPGHHSALQCVDLFRATDSLIGFDLPSLSIVYSAASLAGAFSGLLAAAILHMDGIGGKPGWAWIFILEGLFTVFFGLLSFFVIPRSAKHCTLLNAREREYVMDRLREDGALSQHESADHFAWGEIVQALKFPHVWFILVLFFFNGILIYSLGYTRAQLMTVPPYAVGFVVTNVGSYIADHYKLRGAVRIVCSICLTAGFAMFLASHSTSVQYGSLFLAIPGANAVSPAITSWVANNTAPHVRRASAIAFACILTNLGGILATWLLGSLSPPPRYTSATVVLLVASVGLGIAAAGNVVYLWDQNRRKYRVRAVVSKDEEPEGLGDRSAWFTYIL